MDQIPVIYTEPYLLAPTVSSIDVCWLTSVPTEESYVEYGEYREGEYRERLNSCLRADATTYSIHGMKLPGADGEYTEPAEVYQQFAHINDLKAGTRYFYRVVSGDGSCNGGKVISRDFDFRTAPEPGTAFSFLILSDLQLMPKAPMSLKVAGLQGSDFIIYNGDFVFAPYKLDEWLRLFAMFQQTDDHCRLLQYLPIFPCPGNHEITDQQALKDKNLAKLENMDLSIYMQLFRSYYPEQEYSSNGQHWYSVDYGDLHLVSLATVRWFSYPATESPGWFIFDDIQIGSRQYNWLKTDLESKGTRYTWISQHWHMFNRGTDTQIAFTDPVPSPSTPGLMEYPREMDYIHRDIKPLFERYGVDAVSFGHSHVYERYFINGIHYIEAASCGNCYRNENDPDEPYGNKPIIEENNFRSIMVVSVASDEGIWAKGIQTSVEKGVGSIGRVFDSFQIAPAR